MNTWRMQDAKARLSELVKLAEVDGPQDITLQGRSAAVVLSRAAYQRRSGQGASLADFMQASPLAGLEDELSCERADSLSRDISFLSARKDLLSASLVNPWHSS